MLKQDLLIKKHLFDPHKYFGSPQFVTYEEASQFHQARLNAMFAVGEAKTERKTRSKVGSKVSEIRIDENSPFAKGKTSEISN
jgi:hypothetical protein